MEFYASTLGRGPFADMYDMIAWLQSQSQLATMTEVNAIHSQFLTSILWRFSLDRTYGRNQKNLPQGEELERFVRTVYKGTGSDGEMEYFRSTEEFLGSYNELAVSLRRTVNAIYLRLQERWVIVGESEMTTEEADSPVPAAWQPFLRPLSWIEEVIWHQGAIRGLNVLRRVMGMEPIVITRISVPRRAQAEIEFEIPGEVGESGWSAGVALAAPAAWGGLLSLGLLHGVWAAVIPAGVMTTLHVWQGFVNPASDLRQGSRLLAAAA